MFAKIQALFYLQKKFRQTFCEQRGKPKIAYYGVLEDWDFQKENFFVYASYASCVYSEENKKVAIMGAKEDSEPIWENFFSVWENM